MSYLRSQYTKIDSHMIRVWDPCWAAAALGGGRYLGCFTRTKKIISVLWREGAHILACVCVSLHVCIDKWQTHTAKATQSLSVVEEFCCAKDVACCFFLLKANLLLSVYLKRRKSPFFNARIDNLLIRTGGSGAADILLKTKWVASYRIKCIFG